MFSVARVAFFARHNHCNPLQASFIMSADNPVRKTHNSRKHLATDFDWEGLEALTLPTADDLFPDLREPQLRAARLSAFSPPGEDTSLDSRPRTKDGKDLGKAVKPKQELQDQSPNRPILPVLQGRSSDLQRLALVKQTHELEIPKLELQLELAKLTSASPPASKPSTSEDSSKSMGDLKAPQRTRFPQPYPHIFAPGEPQLYSDLSLPAFCAGYIAIMQQHKDKLALNESYISHFQDLMVLSCSYKWSAVRAYHYKVLRSIELGLVKWGDSGPNAFTLRIPVPSALTIPEWRSRLRNYYDLELCDFLEFGWLVGYVAADLPVSSHHNHESALSSPQTINSFLYTECHLGATCGPFITNPLCVDLVTSPLQIAHSRSGKTPQLSPRFLRQQRHSFRHLSRHTFCPTATWR